MTPVKPVKYHPTERVSAQVEGTPDDSEVIPTR